ncbi:MAG TPA: helix-turn-helix domain-containing protein [Dehalococcoidia bacterium]|nr:helix-turn-helix domain-containing protein [Dehalococcoidia bacterium]
MPTTGEDQLLRVPQVAQRLGLSTATVLAWLRDGRLKGFRLGGTRAGWRVRAEDLDAFIADRAGERGDAP